MVREESESTAQFKDEEEGDGEEGAEAEADADGEPCFEREGVVSAQMEKRVVEGPEFVVAVAAGYGGGGGSVGVSREEIGRVGLWVSSWHPEPSESSSFHCSMVSAICWFYFQRRQIFCSLGLGTCSLVFWTEFL